MKDYKGFYNRLVDGGDFGMECTWCSQVVSACHCIPKEHIDESGKAREVLKLVDITSAEREILKS